MLETWQRELLEFSRNINMEESKIRKQSHFTVPSLQGLRSVDFVAMASSQ